MTLYKVSSLIPSQEELNNAVLSLHITHQDGIEEIREDKFNIFIASPMTSDLGIVYLLDVWNEHLGTDITYAIGLATRTGTVDLFDTQLIIKETGLYIGLAQNVGQTFMSIQYNSHKTLNAKHLTIMENIGNI